MDGKSEKFPVVYFTLEEKYGLKLQIYFQVNFVNETSESIFFLNETFR